MAVYTEVSDEELAAYLAAYDLGQVLACKGIAEGVENSNYFLQTEAGSFILTLYEKRVREAEIHHKRGRHVILVGHAGHPEVAGTMGQLPPGAITLIETLGDVASLVVPDAENLAYVTQTTLSVDDTREIVEALTARFPAIVGPHKEDICYATTMSASTTGATRFTASCRFVVA